MAENTFVLKLRDGADIAEGLEKLAHEKEIDYGMLVSGSGRIRDFELISHEPKGAINRMKFDAPAELHAISGKIQKRKNGRVETNVRVSVSSTGFTARAGELVSGKASGALEIGIRKVDMKKIIEA